MGGGLAGVVEGVVGESRERVLVCVAVVVPVGRVKWKHELKAVVLVEVEAGLRVGKNWTARRGQVSGGHLEFGVCVCGDGPRGSEQRPGPCTSLCLPRSASLTGAGAALRSLMPITIRGGRRSEQSLALPTPNRGAAREQIWCAANQRAGHAQSRVETPMADREVETLAALRARAWANGCAWCVAE